MGYAIKTHSRGFLVLTLSALPRFSVFSFTPNFSVILSHDWSVGLFNIISYPQLKKCDGKPVTTPQASLTVPLIALIGLPTAHQQLMYMIQNRTRLQKASSEVIVQIT
jgi:hypothetical protein